MDDHPGLIQDHVRQSESSVFSGWSWTAVLAEVGHDGKQFESPLTLRLGLLRFCTILGYGILCENDDKVEQIRALQQQEIPIRLAIIPKAQGERFLGFLDLQRGLNGKALALHPGDKLTVFFDYQSQHPQQKWEAMMIPRPAITPHPLVPVLLSNSLGSNATLNIKAIDVSTLSTDRAKDAITAEKPQLVKVKISSSEISFHRETRGHYDLDSWSASVGFNAEQAEAFESLHELPGGVGVYQGAPGTGKTFWLLRVLLPIVAHAQTNPQHPEKRPQVMLLGPSKEIADHLALEMQSLIDCTYPDRGLFVTRIISNIRDDELTTAHLMGRMDADQVSRRGDMSNNQDIDRLGLGYRMLQLSGIMQCPWSEAEKFGRFRKYFEEYEICGKKPDSFQLMEYRKEVSDLRDAVLSRSEVVVCTPFAAGTAAVRQNVHPYVVAVDEAARVTDPELWPMLVSHEPRVCLLVGDQRQLPPFVSAKFPASPFRPQLELSLFARLIYNGHQDIIFREQHGMVYQLQELVNDKFYKSMLRTTDNVDPGVVETNIQLVAHNVQTFGKVLPLLFLNVPGTQEKPDTAGNSLCNDVNLAAVCALIQSLIESQIKAKQITVLTPYRAQASLYTRSLQSFPELRNVRAHTVDSYQGCESDVVILDTTATSIERLKFLADANRLCVALSRSRAGMFIVGDRVLIRGRDKWGKCQDDRFKHILDVHDFLYRIDAFSDIPASFTQDADRAPERLRQPSSLRSGCTGSVGGRLSAGTRATLVERGRTVQRNSISAANITSPLSSSGDDNSEMRPSNAPIPAPQEPLHANIEDYISVNVNDRQPNRDDDAASSLDLASDSTSIIFAGNTPRAPGPCDHLPAAIGPYDIGPCIAQVPEIAGITFTALERQRIANFINNLISLRRRDSFGSSVAEA
ncbi:uncharacterized protein DSM5745_03626 [Aspergillus mulundensis]|uniref:AAA+ ATPase domain-containing protein n=1 Tax=Aspergillus mulundensis TaxID=1810919 RepID=A0A3D8SLB5_9EURO|nr:hypothetical protein DSM5745_03626 [Aspergillus mulundensis]RDW86984.1 hypothetical protein DSM5745_03626 [Aspergillus mulundensis]